MRLVLLMSPALFLAVPGLVRGAESYDACAGFIDAVPAIITSQGVWCLRGDVSTAATSGTAIQIDANNVTLDCNGFKVGGLAAGHDTTAVGIGSGERAGMTIRNCNVRGFQYGMLLAGLGGTIEDNRLESNRRTGIAVTGEDMIVRRNFVLDTGHPTSTPGNSTNAYGIQMSGNGDILDNTVVNVFTLDPTIGLSNGIRTANLTAGDVSGNRVRGVTGFNVRNIHHQSSTAVQTHGNHIVSGAYTEASFGVFCSNALGLAVDNLISGTSVPVTNCTASGNVDN